MLLGGGVSRERYVFGAVLALALGGFMTWVSMSQSHLPIYDALDSASGSVVRWEKTRHSVTFTLSGSPETFIYSAGSGDLYGIQQAIKRARHLVIRYDAIEPARPWLSDDVYMTVYEVVADGVVVRPYRDVATSLQLETRVGMYGALFCLVLAVYQAWCAFNTPRGGGWQRIRGIGR